MAAGAKHDPALFDPTSFDTFHFTARDRAWRRLPSTISLERAVERDWLVMATSLVVSTGAVLGHRQTCRRC
jgi:predicted DCC family thiol-disulfide oxidoreductase YuxK